MFNYTCLPNSQQINGKYFIFEYIIVSFLQNEARMTKQKSVAHEIFYLSRISNKFIYFSSDLFASFSHPSTKNDKLLNNSFDTGNVASINSDYREYPAERYQKKWRKHNITHFV